MAEIAELAEVFRQCLELGGDVDVDSLVYNETPGWDSLNHLNIVAAIEDRFGVMLETDDILGMSDFSAAVNVLRKYDVLPAKN